MRFPEEEELLSAARARGGYLQWRQLGGRGEEGAGHVQGAAEQGLDFEALLVAGLTSYSPRVSANRAILSKEFIKLH